MAYSSDNRWKDAGNDNDRMLSNLFARDLLEEQISNRPADRDKNLDPELEERIWGLAQRYSKSIKDWKGKEGSLHAEFIEVNIVPGAPSITTAQGMFYWLASTIITLQNSQFELFYANNEIEQLGLLNVYKGDICIRTDEEKSYVAIIDNPQSMGDWQVVGVLSASTINSFLGLTDTPSSYSGHGGKVVKVKGAEDGLEFGDVEAANVSYSNAGQPTITNVEEALDILLRQPPQIDSISGGQTVEKGSTVSSVTVGWTLSGDTPIYSSLTDVPGFDINSYPGVYNFTGLSLTTNKTYILTVGDDVEDPSDSSSISINFRNRVHHGTSSNTSINATELRAMDYTLDNNRLRSFTIDGNGEYIYIAHPVAYGVGEIWVGGLLTTSWVQTTLLYPNAGGAGENYYVFRSNTLQYGTNINIEVK